MALIAKDIIIFFEASADADRKTKGRKVVIIVMNAIKNVTNNLTVDR